MKRIFAILVLLALPACAGLEGSTPESNLYLACKSFSVTERNLAPHKDAMSEEQVAAMRQAFEVVVPICTQEVAQIGDLEVALAAVNRQLESMLEIEREVR